MKSRRRVNSTVRLLLFVTMSKRPKVPPPTKGAEEAGRLYRQAIKLAKEGEFEKAVRCATAIEATGFRLKLTFRNEALLEIVSYCCDAGLTTKAREIAKQIDLPQFQMRALDVIGARSD
jgi:hypothetical protein